MNILEKKSWSPYAVGAGIGVLSWISFLTAKKPIGITTAFENTAAGLGQRFAPKASGVNAYLAKNEEVPKLDWEWMLAAGVALGSWLSSTASGDREAERVPAVWASRFGSSSVTRDVGAFIGGALMMFGARVAKGCTSGHAISGTQQLAASSWIFSPVMAAAAAGVARALFGKAAARAH
ncbi:MAG: YeeE/YedE family protein [Deltaproteobacteria bacterium]|nr:YeeE/YedE family protein [Deltaproteobacteria bacterium]